MSFGGGGGSTGVSAHIHDSSAGEGGSLKLNNGANTTTFNVGSGTDNIPLEALM